VDRFRWGCVGDVQEGDGERGGGEERKCSFLSFQLGLIRVLIRPELRYATATS
jgi:hypothetical protein